jgi:hypothetical protein
MPTEAESLEVIAQALLDLAARDVSITVNGKGAIYQVFGRAISSGSSQTGMGSPWSWRPQEVPTEAPVTGNYLWVGTRSEFVDVVLPSSLMETADGPIWIKDESGQAESFPINITSEGGELFDFAGTVQITTAFGCLSFIPRGGKWRVLTYYGG